MSRLAMVMAMVMLVFLPAFSVGGDAVVFTFKITGQPDQTFEVEMPAGTLAKAVEAFSSMYERPATVVDKNGATVPNPVTPPRWMAQKIREFCIEVTRAHVIKVASQSAANQAAAQLNLLEKAITVKEQAPPVTP